MKRQHSNANCSLCIAALVALATAPAAAQGAHCGVIKAQAQGLGPSAGSNLSPARRKFTYNLAFAKARNVAITNWQNMVIVKCAGDSRLWVRARSKSVTECDRAMGGRFSVCVAGRPGRKYFD